MKKIYTKPFVEVVFMEGVAPLLTVSIRTKEDDVDPSGDEGVERGQDPWNF